MDIGFVMLVLSGASSVIALVLAMFVLLFAPLSARTFDRIQFVTVAFLMMSGLCLILAALSAIGF